MRRQAHNRARGLPHNRRRSGRACSDLRRRRRAYTQPWKLGISYSSMLLRMISSTYLRAFLSYVRGPPRSSRSRTAAASVSLKAPALILSIYMLGTDDHGRRLESNEWQTKLTLPLVGYPLGIRILDDPGPGRLVGGTIMGLAVIERECILSTVPQLLLFQQS